MAKGEEMRQMRRWLRRRRERVERIEDEAGELIRLLGGDAYGEARWREQTASSCVTAEEWNLIALAIARQTGRRIGLDVSTRMAMNAVFAPDRKPAEGKPQPNPAAPDPLLDELKRILAATPQPFRVQFVGAAPGRGIQSHNVVLPTATHGQIRLRCIAQPDAAQAALLDRLGLVLPKRMRPPESNSPILALSA